MKLILHIGMGKTGTSSIQLALSQSAKMLKAQNVIYLGMWFDMIDAEFKGVVNQSKFFRQPAATIQKQALAFCDYLEMSAKENQVDTFIISNEALSGKASVLEPFLNEIVKRGIEVKIIGYVRDPSSWLPSAYVQWGIRDKTEQGPVKSYDEMARILIHWYNGLLEWSNKMGDILDIRHYDTAGDIVQDFSQAAGIELTINSERTLERGEDCEILLRALFSTRFQQHVLPNLFNRAVIGNSKVYPVLEDSITKYFDYESTDQIIQDNHVLFEQYRERLGIDLLTNKSEPPKTPQPQDIRRRMLDYLIEITLDQARRINHLEKQVSEINQKLE